MISHKTRITKHASQNGFSLVEIIIAVAIFGLFATALIGLIMNSYGSNFQAKERDIAVLYAEEGMEAVWSIRRQAWNLLANGDHGLSNASNYWEFSGTTELIDDKFTRVITIEDACRDGSGDLADCPATTTDLNSKKITVTVTYTAITYVSNVVEFVNYLTTWQSRDWIQTDWVGGSGQSIWSDDTRYDTDDGNIDTSIAGQVTLATSGGAGCGTKTWDFDDGLNYTYVSTDIEVVLDTDGITTVAQLKGSTGSCSDNPGAEACTTLDETDCGIQLGCTWGGGSGSCANLVGGACIGLKGGACNACGIANCVKQGGSCLDGPGGGLDCTLITDPALCGVGGCAQCEWTGPSDSCLDDPVAAACTPLNETDCGTQFGCDWASGAYPINNPDINPTDSFSVSDINAWSSFTEVATKNGGEIYYQLSDDGGNTWQYWNSGTSNWETASATDYNTAVEINTNISSFDTTSEQIKFKAFLSSNGSQQVKLDKISISCSQNKSWGFDDGSNYTYDNSKIVVNDPTALSMAQLKGSSGGSNTWDFDNGLNYTYVSTDIEVVLDTDGITTVAQLKGSAGSCSDNPGAEACTTLDETDCGIQLGCTWGGGSGSCANLAGGSCSAVAGNQCNSLCSIANCSKSKGQCTGTLQCDLIADSNLCGVGGCTQCEWTGPSDSCLDDPVAAACTPLNETDCGTQFGCDWASGAYPINNPDIQPDNAYTPSLTGSWSAFTEVATKNGGEIQYKLFDGTTWYYYSEGWQSTDSTTVGESSTAAVINDNIGTFTIASGQINFKAFLMSDGTQQIKLDSIIISWSDGAPGSCSDNPGAEACTTLDETDCGIQLGCTWGGGSGSCANLVGGACIGLKGGACNACGIANCVKQGGSCLDGPGGGLDCTLITDPALCGVGGCAQCEWTGPSDSCLDDPVAAACTPLNETDCGTQFGCTWSGGGFPTDKPSIEPSSTHPVSSLGNWTSFVEVATKNGGEIQYKLFDSVSWYWHNGSDWTTIPDDNNFTITNTAAQIQDNIDTFPTTNEEIKFRAFLSSDGSQQVQLDNISISWTERGTCSGDDVVCEAYIDQITCEADIINNCSWTEGGGNDFVSFGTFTSSAFDTGASSSFNIVTWNDIIPPCTPDCTVQLRVRTAPDSGGSPGTWSAWYGVGGSGTYFTDKIGTIISTDLNFDQWMQYRVELAGDGLDTPIFQDISVNYTP